LIVDQKILFCAFFLNKHTAEDFIPTAENRVKQRFHGIRGFFELFYICYLDFA